MVVNQKAGIIVQARVRSSRLPGKVLASIGPTTLLEHLIHRLKQSNETEGIVIATGDHPANQPIVDLCERVGISSYVGPEDDALARIIGAALEFDFGNVVRVTGDNPLTDPWGIDDGIRYFRDGKTDYFDNICYEGFPHGVGFEIVSRDALCFSHSQWASQENREHVTWAIRRHIDVFNYARFRAPKSLHRPNYRVSVDNAEDLEVVQAIYGYFHWRDDMPLREIIAFLDAHPEIVAMNADNVDHLMTQQDLKEWQLPIDEKTRSAWLHIQNCVVERA